MANLKEKTIEVIGPVQQSYFSFEPFDKNTMKWSMWIERLEISFDIFGCNIAKRNLFLLHYMGQSTYELLSEKIAPAKPSKITYDNIVQILSEHFKPETSSEDQLNNESSLLNISTELFDEIFKYLNLNELATMSLTCRKLKNLTESYYQRNYANENYGHVRVISEVGKVYFDTNSSELFEIRFRSFIPNLHVIFHEKCSILKTFQLIEPLCAKRLVYLHLQFNDAWPIDIAAINFLIKYVQHLKVLKMDNVLNAGQLLRMCINLEILYINSCKNLGINIKFSEQRFSKLKTLILLRYYEIGYEFELKYFLQNNLQLENVICTNSHDVEAILLTENKLRYVGIPSNNYIYIPDENLKRFFSKKFIEWIDLRVHGYYLKQISEMKSTHIGLHILVNNTRSYQNTNNEIEDTFPNEFEIQPHIKRLCLTIKKGFTQRELNKIVEIYPNLIDIRLRLYDGQSEWCEMPVLFQFISQLKKLKHIYIEKKISNPDNRNRYSNVIFKLSPDDVEELHLARINLIDAPHVTIHVSHRNVNINMLPELKNRMISFKINDEDLCPLCNERQAKMSDVFNYIELPIQQLNALK